MTDLSKGVVEINGISITATTTLSDMEHVDDCADHIVSRNGKVEIFVFKHICLYGVHFDIDVTFINKKLSDIELRSNYEGSVHYEERFKSDCEWLRQALGEPTEVKENGIFYYYEGLRINSFIQLDLSRNPAETFITCKYGG